MKMLQRACRRTFATAALKAKSDSSAIQRLAKSDIVFARFLSTIEHSDRSFVPLTPEHAKAAAECVAETFATQDDPFSWLFNLKRHHWITMSSMFIDRAAKSDVPLSVVALNSKTGGVDGVMINEDWATPRPSAYRTHLPSDWWPVRSLFADLHQEYVARMRGPPPSGSTIRCMYFTCVHPSARGKGVMKNLWAKTVEVARENGYSYITAQAGSENVRQVLEEHLGFDEIAALPYATYEYEGQKLFKELVERDPMQFSRLSIHRRNVPSNLYV